MQDKNIPQFEVADYISRRRWNNATILASSLYAPDFSLFRKSHVCVDEQQSVKTFLKALTKSLEDNDNPEEALESLCHLGGLKGNQKGGHKGGA